MTPFVGIAVELRRKAAVGFWRDDRLDLLLDQGASYPVCIERPVGEELVASEPFEQRRCAPQIVSLPGQQSEVDQIAKCVGQGHDLGCHAAARAPDGLALSPPFAPCPWR